MNITFIGMAGAGKSHIGRLLAQEIEYEFVDSDKLLSQKFGKDIQSLLEELGDEKYLQAEAEAGIEGTRGRDNLVIAPAGSVIYVDEWTDHLKDISTLVYLRVPFEVIEERLRNISPRAIVGLGKKTLRELYDERHPLYMAHADHVVSADGQSAAALVEKIGRLLFT